MVFVTAEIIISEQEIDFTFARSSGPGGQNVNKVNSKVVLRWKMRSSDALPLGPRVRFLEKFGSRLTVDGDLVISSDRHRDQAKNKQDCIDKLRSLLLEIVHPPRARRKTKPSRSSVEKRKNQKKQRGETKKNRGRIRHDG